MHALLQSCACWPGCAARAVVPPKNPGEGDVLGRLTGGRGRAPVSTPGEPWRLARQEKLVTRRTAWSSLTPVHAVGTAKPHCNVTGGRPQEVATGLAPPCLLLRRLRPKPSGKATGARQPSCGPAAPHPPATPCRLPAVSYPSPAAWIRCAHMALPAPVCNSSGCQLCLHCPAGACMGCGAARSPRGRSPPTDGPDLLSCWRQLPLLLCCCWRIVDAPGNHQAIARIVTPDRGLGSSHLQPLKRPKCAKNACWSGPACVP